MGPLDTPPNNRHRASFTPRMLTLFVFANPLMTVPDKLVLQSPAPDKTDLAAKVWSPRQKTRWTLANGIVSGEPSTPEYQAGRKDHKGLEPRMAIPSTPQDFCAEFDIRFSGGTFTKLAPFIEYGHHKARFSFQKDGLSLDADSGKAKLATTDKVTFQDGHWYHVVAEQKGDEVLMQVDGVTLYGTHPTLKEPATKGAAGLGFCGTQGGTIDIRDLKAWSIKPDYAPGWSEVKAKLVGKS
ncbi:MAG: hypothetical protein GC165_20150 [Armatimonadetes bacterium]|nr:hypothetical protein [Armatimonadota bacterium]